MIPTSWRIAAAAITACFVVSLPAQSKDYSNFPDRPISFLAQAAPGSGFDAVTRAVADTLAAEGLVKVGMPVTNFPSSAVGTQTVVNRHKGDAYMLSFNSISGMMRYATGQSPYSHEDFTPIARLISDYYTVIVRKDSKLQSLQDFIEALRADPKAFPIAGGQSDDRVFYGLMFKAAGIDPAAINYVPFSGGGEASALLLEGSAGAQISTLADVAGLISSGEARSLAFSGSNRLKGDFANIPTLKEQGVDVEWQNFRYALGGPDMPPEVVKFWQETLAKMVKTPTWEKVLARYRWNDEFMVEGFDRYLDESQARITEITKSLGMASR